ncbi:MAG: siroheme synthase CysG, partial [Beijerinckiaceae bacterium]
MAENQGTADSIGRAGRRAAGGEPVMQPLTQLPVFYDLAGKPAVLAGHSGAALWKAQLLASTGAQLRVFCAEPSEGMDALAAASPNVTIEHRKWTTGDIEGAVMALCDAQSDAEAESFRAAAKAAGVPVNIIDKPAYCDFQFGSIVNRSPLVVGIATGGAAPVFAQSVRGRIETLLPPGFSLWARTAQEWRPAVQALDLDFRARRTFWEGFADRALKQPDSAPDAQLRDDLLARARQQDADGAKGSVAMVGAGPGDPELITLKAVRALQSADVVLYDDLVSRPVLDYARREAERIYVGKRGYRPSWGQADICALLVQHARAGKAVVRLKGGDPMIFGRANEEIVALEKAGIDYTVIPGVTAASGAAASLGVSLTEREISRRVQFVTAHSNKGKLPEDLDWQAIADPRATTVVYMGIRTFGELAQRLIAEGADPQTP